MKIEYELVILVEKKTIGRIYKIDTSSVGLDITQDGRNGTVKSNVIAAILWKVEIILFIQEKN